MPSRQLAEKLVLLYMKSMSLWGSSSKHVPSYVVTLTTAKLKLYD